MANYAAVRARVDAINSGALLVAVSKRHPIGDLQLAFDRGCRTFGENMVDELLEKAPLLPHATFHLIGHLQGNKVKKLCRVRNLGMVESVDSIKLARALSTAWRGPDPLPILVQVNVAASPAKSGVAREDAWALVQQIRETCPRVLWKGFMTIGEPGQEEADFAALASVREDVALRLGVPPDSFHLSMGMSDTFELALRMGATIVRVGTLIFGARGT